MEITYKNDELKIKSKNGSFLLSGKELKIERPDGTSKEIMGPGEYEIAGISVIGLKNESEIFYVYELENLRILDGRLLSKKLIDTKLSQVGDIDVLLLSVNNESINLMQQIEGYYVLPLKSESKEALDKFLKDSGAVVTTMPKFNLKKDDVIDDQATEIVILEN